MNPAPTKPWQTRLAEMNHSRGTSNKMIQDAMQSEISDLRKQLKPELVEWRRAKLVQVKSTKTEERLGKELSVARTETLALRRSLAQATKSNQVAVGALGKMKSEFGDERRARKLEIASLRKSLCVARRARDEWRVQAMKYQKQLIEKSLRP